MVTAMTVAILAGLGRKPSCPTLTSYICRKLPVLARGFYLVQLDDPCCLGIIVSESHYKNRDNGKGIIRVDRRLYLRRLGINAMLPSTENPHCGSVSHARR